MRIPSRLSCLATLAAIVAPAQIDDAARRPYDALVKKQHVGGRITAEERQSMMKVFPQLHPARESYGMVALTDLGAAMYKGELGGLYPGGVNRTPPDHLRAGLERARQMVSLDSEGRPSPNGKIALMSIGMSNTTMEYQTFMKMAAQDKELNPRLVLVDGAQPGQSALETSDTKSNYWNVVEQRMTAAGVTARQVQAVWMFQVVVTPYRPFPLDVRRLQNLMVDTLHVASDRFPHLKIAYLSSRIYAGYALVPQNPEPHSYESGFAPKWIIADQIAGYLELNYDPSRGRVRFPWVAWGPYMWADGVKGRKDGLKWVREDFGADGMHPSNSGREKVARMLLQFLKTDPTSKPWFLANGTPGAAQGLDPGAIRQKVQRGEQLTPEERQFIQQRPASQNQQNAQQRRAQYLKEHPPQSSLGLIPLTDLGSGAYKGEEGGLYPGGKNSPPAGHWQAGVALARQIAPLDADGKRSADGKIALLSIGFSNPSIEFPAFQKLLNEDAAVNPRLVTVNGCVGSQAASVIGDPNSGYWNTVDQRLSAAGVTRHQVQAVWLKEVNPGPSQPFPVESKKLYNDLISTLHNLQDRFPNLKVAYLSSRTYGGYTELGGSPEPWAYETGFAVKWVVSDQIAGKPEVNYDPSKGAVRSPWIEWGPYLWTDGVKGRQDGFVYLREDLGEDGLHPSEKGSAKIASLMMNFFKTDPATRIWFLKVGQAAGQQPSQKQIQYGYGPMDWVEPDTTPVEGTAYKIFHSKTIQADVNYLVYLPPDYEQQKTTRYPVLYELPASGQTTKGGAEIVRRVDQGIRAGRISPMIIVLVNGLRGNTMYCDSRDGRYPLETVIVKDLVPHVDAAYRTVASREGRGLDGFSMGGFGAAHLGLKYPDVFGVLSIMAPPLLGPELTQQLPKQAWSRLFPTAMAGDPDYFRANDPFTLVEKNAGKLRDRTVIRIVAHMEDQQWLWPQCEKLHKLMAQHMIQHEFYFLTNVKSHNRAQCLNTMGEGAVAFFSSSLLRPAANGQAPARTAAAPGPDEKWESFPDGSTGRAVEFHGVGGAAIPAYIRKPKGAGPIPVVVMAHGGRYGKAPTEGMGRSTKSPTQDFIDAGWAVYSIDYRPSEKIAIVPIEFDDTVEAVQTVRKFPFIDASRVGYMGGSHGAQVGSRVVSRVDMRGAILCAPAALDLIEDKKAVGRGEPVVAILKKMIADLEEKLGAKAEEIEKNPAKYGYSSALTEVAQVRCPILIVNGLNDDNSPPSIIDVYVKKLRAAGKQVETYLPSNGPHGFYFGRPDIPEWKEASQRAVAFFRRQFGQ